MDAERLERAARALLVRVDGLCGGKGSAFALPSDALRSERDALRAALAAQPAQAWRDSFPPTHYCRECKALWRRWPDGSWSLVTAACGKCCDNVPMGEQIVALGDPCAAPASAEAVAREAAEFALREFCRMEDIPLDRIQPSDISRAVAHALRAKGAK